MKILNFGSLNLDYVYKVESFVNAGETIAANSLNMSMGGKGLNQSIAIARAGMQVFHAGMIGAEGIELKNYLNANGVDTRYIDQTDGRQGHAIIQVNTHGNNCIIIYGGSNQKITKAYIDNVLNEFSVGDYMLLQNEISNVDYAINSAYERGLNVVLNVSPIDESIIHMALNKTAWLAINEIEGAALTGCKTIDEIEKQLKKKFPKTGIILTLGRQGAVCIDGLERLSHGVYDVPIVDTTAAGDTFVGYFISCLAQGFSKEEALEKASAASSVVVSRAGAAISIPSMEETTAFLTKNIEKAD
jgi:ribokinase